MALSATLSVNKVYTSVTLFCYRGIETLPCCPESANLPYFPEIQVYYHVIETSVIPLSFQENVMALENENQVYSVMPFYSPGNVTLLYYQEKETHETHCSPETEIRISHASETLS